jgi:hypothetical protein
MSDKPQVRIHQWGSIDALTGVLARMNRVLGSGSFVGSYIVPLNITWQAYQRCSESFPIKGWIFQTPT